MVSSPPPSLMPQMSPLRESDSTQLYQMVPADLLRRARHVSTPPPPPSSNKANPTPFSGLREDPWAIADERTAVFAPPPELLASVRAAAASAGLLANNTQPSDPEAEARITAEFTLTESGSQRIEEHEVTKVAPPPAEATETPLADAPGEALASRDEDGDVDSRSRRRWPWAVAVVLIASALAAMAMRSQAAQRPSKPHVVAPAR